MQTLKSFIKRVLEKGVPDGDGVYVDVGAHQGGVAQVIRKYKPDIQMHLIEPYSENCAVLARLGFLADRYAISNCDGTKALYFRSDGKGTKSCSLYKDHLGRHRVRQEVVPCISLDEYCKHIPHVYIMKINAEGAEYEIFDMPCEWLSRTDMVFLQLHEGDHERIGAKLLKSGFVLRKETRGKRRNQWWCK